MRQPCIEILVVRLCVIAQRIIARVEARCYRPMEQDRPELTGVPGSGEALLGARPRVIVGPCAVEVDRRPAERVWAGWVGVLVASAEVHEIVAAAEIANPAGDIEIGLFTGN